MIKANDCLVVEIFTKVDLGNYRSRDSFPSIMLDLFS